ncbi:hypothetical protein D3C75_814120 [compost metagenome]
MAKHPHITFEAASLLATDERAIRETLAANNATPVDVLLNLHFGDKSKSVIDLSFVSIKRQPVEAWGRAAERGLSLDDHMAGKSLGEWLLERGLTEAYQAVQVVNLTQRVTEMAQPGAAADSAPPAITHNKLRM